MSEELLQKFLSSIEQEDGIVEKTKRKKNKSVALRNNVKTILNAASRGQVELSAEESYIIQTPTTSRNTDYIDDRLASKGFSLIDQARSHKPKDLKKRNLKYMKYQESRKLDPKKARLLVNEHMSKKTDLRELRKQKNKIIGVKEPRRVLPGQKKKTKSGSVFSDADFAQVGKHAKKVASLSDHSFI